MSSRARPPHSAASEHAPAAAPAAPRTPPAGAETEGATAAGGWAEAARGAVETVVGLGVLGLLRVRSEGPRIEAELARRGLEPLAAISRSAGEAVDQTRPPAPPAARPSGRPRRPGRLSVAVRVAVDVTSLLDRPTGIGTFAREVLVRLVNDERLEVRPFAVTWRGRRGLADLDARASASAAIRVPPANPTGRRLGWRPPMAARPLRALWKRLDGPPIEWWTGPVDVVWGPNFVVPPSRRAARVVSVHDLTPVRFPELCNRDTLDYPVLVRRAVAGGALVQADSEAVAGEVRRWLDLPADRVVVVPLGVTAITGGNPARGRQLAGSERYVLALGTVEPRKDLPTLVRAFDRAAGRRADLGLVVGGPDGWGTSAFETAVAEATHRDRIRRLGWVDDTARADLLAGAACLAYPSIYEGFGLPPLEALAAGVPVVTSDLPVLVEVTGDAADHVPVGDAEALAGALVDLVDLAERPPDDPRRAERRRRGLARAAGYSWDRCASGLADLLLHAASGAPQGAGPPPPQAAP